MAASKKRAPAGPVRATAVRGADESSVRGVPLLAVALLVVGVGGLLFPPLPNQPLGLDLVAGWTGIGGLIAAGALLARRERLVPDSGPGRAWMLFLVWALVSALASGRVWAALVGEPANRLGWMTLAALTALAIAASALSGPVRRLLRQHAWWIVLAEAAFTLFRLSTTHDSTVGGTLPNSTDLGQAFLLLLPWVLPDESVTAPAARRMRYGTIALAVLTLAATQSRASLVVAGVWFVWVLARRWKAPTVRKATAFVALVALGVVAAVSFTPVSILDPDGSLPFGGRLATWELAVRAVGERPVLGWGPDGFWPGAASVRTTEMTAEATSLLLGPGACDPHDVLLWFAVSTGVVGLGLALWAVAGHVVEWRRIARADPDSGAALWAVGGCLAVGLLSPLALHVAPLLAIVLGTALERQRGERSRGALRAPAWANAAVAFVLALAGLALGLNAFSRAPFEVASAERSPALVTQADSMRRMWALDAHMAYLTSLHAGWAAQVDPGAGWQQADLAAMDSAIERDTRNPFYALERARAVRYYLSDPAAIDAAFALAFERYPAYPLARAEYAAYLAQAGRVDEARVQLDLVRTIDDKDPARAAAVEAAEAAIAEATQ